MRIKMLALSASPDGVRQIGDVVDVTDAEGKELVAGGFAEAATGRTPSRAETAAIEPPENTALPRGRKHQAER